MKPKTVALCPDLAAKMRELGADSWIFEDIVNAFRAIVQSDFSQEAIKALGRMSPPGLMMPALRSQQDAQQSLYDPDVVLPEDFALYFMYTALHFIRAEQRQQTIDGCVRVLVHNDITSSTAGVRRLMAYSSMVSSAEQTARGSELTRQVFDAIVQSQAHLHFFEHAAGLLYSTCGCYGPGLDTNLLVYLYQLLTETDMFYKFFPDGAQQMRAHEHLQQYLQRLQNLTPIRLWEKLRACLNQELTERSLSVYPERMRTIEAPNVINKFWAKGQALQGIDFRLFSYALCLGLRAKLDLFIQENAGDSYFNLLMRKIDPMPLDEIAIAFHGRPDFVDAHIVKRSALQSYLSNNLFAQVMPLLQVNMKCVSDWIVDSMVIRATRLYYSSIGADDFDAPLLKAASIENMVATLQSAADIDILRRLQSSAAQAAAGAPSDPALDEAKRLVSTGKREVIVVERPDSSDSELDELQNAFARHL